MDVPSTYSKAGAGLNHILAEQCRKYYKENLQAVHLSLYKPKP